MCEGTKKQYNHWLWIFPAIVPLLVIINSYFLDIWYWGLMDDHAILSTGHDFASRHSTNAWLDRLE